MTAKMINMIGKYTNGEINIYGNRKRTMTKIEQHGEMKDKKCTMN